MTSSGRSLFVSLAVAGLAAAGLWLAPLQRPRAVVSDVDVHTFTFWFSSDSQLFATQDLGSRLRIFRVVDGRLVSRLQNDGQMFTYLVFSPDAEQIAGMNETGLVVSWDTATGEQRMRTRAPVEPGYFLMSWAASGALLVQDLQALKQTPPVLRMVDVATNTEAMAVPLPSLGHDFHLSRSPRALPRFAEALCGGRSTPGKRAHDTISTEDAMKKTTLESLEKRVAALEKDLAQVLQARTTPGKFKDWRRAVGKYKVTDLTKAVDEAGRRIREENRRKTAS